MKQRGDALAEMRKLGHSFFKQPAIDLAPALIGKILVRRAGGKEYRARIVETEAYLGPHDLAAHSSKGRTKRTEVMFGPPGHAYVYFIYGMHEMLNVVAGTAGEASAVLLRAAEPLDGWEANLSGPGRLARGMQVKRAENGLDLTGDTLFLATDGRNPSRIVRTKRVGVEYAKEWKDEPLRFLDADSPAVSKPRP
ncbi:MAG: DNA-3-methyladenine glycosylase [Phycisphaerales bacterium]|nr:DNA-3-methyladenine glycosylase [Phycisphaerales bacterium]